MNEKGNGVNLSGLILAVLEDNALHGYGIAREIEKRSEDVLRYGEGSLYPALRGLEKDGFIEGSWDTTGVGAAKKVYRLTSEGVAELRRARVSWHEYSQSVDRVFLGKKSKLGEAQ